MTRKLVYADDATADLRRIQAFIARDNPVAAFDFVTDIRLRLVALEHQPELGRSRTDLGQGLRLFTLDRKVAVIYRVGQDVVEILRIFYGGQDYETIMTASKSKRKRK